MENSIREKVSKIPIDVAPLKVVPGVSCVPVLFYCAGHGGHRILSPLPMQKKGKVASPEKVSPVTGQVIKYIWSQHTKKSRVAKCGIRKTDTQHTGQVIALFLFRKIPYNFMARTVMCYNSRHIVFLILHG